MTDTEAFTLLGLVPGASPSVIRAAYLWRAKIVHPDAGGTREAFAELTKAYALASGYATQEKCPSCKGRGLRFIARGFHSASVTCGPCRGLGFRHR